MGQWLGGLSVGKRPVHDETGAASSFQWPQVGDEVRLSHNDASMFVRITQIREDRIVTGDIVDITDWSNVHPWDWTIGAEVDFPLDRIQAIVRPA